MTFDSKIALAINFSTDNREILGFDFHGVKQIPEDEDDSTSDTITVKSNDADAEAWGVYATLGDGTMELPMWIADLDSKEAANKLTNILKSIQASILKEDLKHYIALVPMAGQHEGFIGQHSITSHSFEKATEWAKMRFNRDFAIIEMPEWADVLPNEVAIRHFIANTKYKDNKYLNNHTVKAEIKDLVGIKNLGLAQISSLKSFSAAVVTAERWLMDARDKKQSIKILIDDFIYVNETNGAYTSQGNVSG